MIAEARFCGFKFAMFYRLLIAGRFLRLRGWILGQWLECEAYERMHEMSTSQRLLVGDEINKSDAQNEILWILSTYDGWKDFPEMDFSIDYLTSRQSELVSRIENERKQGLENSQGELF